MTSNIVFINVAISHRQRWKLPLFMSCFLVIATFVNAFQVSVQPIATRTPSSVLHYSVAADVAQSSHTKEYIQDKIHRGVKPPQQVKIQQKKQHRLQNMIDVNTLQEFQQVVKEQNDNNLTLVRVHAPYCKACKAMAPLLDRFARDHPNINIVQVSWNQQNEGTTDLIKELGVNKVPYGQIYHPKFGLVEEANLGKRYFNDVVKIVETYQMGRCELPNDVNVYTDKFDNPYISLRGGERVSAV